MTEQSIRELRMRDAVESLRNHPYIQSMREFISDAQLKEAAAKLLRTTCPRCNGPQTVEPDSFTGDCNQCYNEIRSARSFKNKGRPTLYTYQRDATVDVMSGICRYVHREPVFKFSKMAGEWAYFGKGRQHPVSVVLGMTPPMEVRYVIDGKPVTQREYESVFHRPTGWALFKAKIGVDMRRLLKELKWLFITIVTVNNNNSYSTGYREGYDQGRADWQD